MYGFSLDAMRKLIGSRNDEALRQLLEKIAIEYHHLAADQRTQINHVVERAVNFGVPFPDLQQETIEHSIAAELLAQFGQEWLITDASGYHASALEEGLWREYRKLASPQTKAFLHAISKGVPIFGQQPPADGMAYAMVGLDRIRVFQPGLREFAELIAYRVNRKRTPSEEEQVGVKFAADLCGWVDEIVKAERDLFFEFA